mmetsp:Transcript_105516/g.227430  ORF Transcript_105516/g.227430 Transcript_105516/m.227430 type:complete len:129 (+) Transcript_105516:2572-2958(+)
MEGMGGMGSMGGMGQSRSNMSRNKMSTAKMSTHNLGGMASQHKFQGSNDKLASNVTQMQELFKVLTAQVDKQKQDMMEASKNLKADEKCPYCERLGNGSRIPQRLVQPLNRNLDGTGSQTPDLISKAH